MRRACIELAGQLKIPGREAATRVQRRHEQYPHSVPSGLRLDPETEADLSSQDSSLHTAEGQRQGGCQEGQEGKMECRQCQEPWKRHSGWLPWSDQGGQGWWQAIGGEPGWLSLEIGKYWTCFTSFVRLLPFPQLGSYNFDEKIFHLGSKRRTKI